MHFLLASPKTYPNLYTHTSKPQVWPNFFPFSIFRFCFPSTLLLLQLLSLQKTLGVEILTQLFLFVSVFVLMCAAEETKIKTTLKLVGISDAARAEGKTDNKNLRAVLRSQNGVNRR